MYIAKIFYPVCDVKSLKINHSFLIKPFFYKTKNAVQECKYLKNEKSF